MSRKRINPESLPDIGHRLRVIREIAGYATQAQMAAELKLTTNAWNNYERGYSRINLDAAMKIWHRWGFDLNYIYLGVVASLPRHLADKVHEIEERESETNGGDRQPA